jgi:hypothetical protein
MLAEVGKKYYISITMLNLDISYIAYALSSVAGALILRKFFALRLATLRNRVTHARTLR